MCSYAFLNALAVKWNRTNGSDAKSLSIKKTPNPIDFIHELYLLFKEEFEFSQTLKTEEGRVFLRS